MRESPFSAAAWEKLEYARTTCPAWPHWLPSGSVVLQEANIARSRPKYRRSTAAAAPPSTAWPES